jgi:glucose-1-phosphate cytidylyltransferase
VKAVFLAGGYGTRLSEETNVRPKPMVEIGGQPILWHIMKLYSAHGIDDFVICCGYKSHVIKEYFANYVRNEADVTFDLAADTVEVHRSEVEPWRVTLIETGENTMTGGRLKRARRWLDDETFCFAYGDCVSNVDITRLIEFHRGTGALVTLTAIRPPGRFGALSLEHEDDFVHAFREKPEGDGGWVNGGFFVVDPAALDYVDGDETVWEQQPLQRLADNGKLAAYRHAGYWQNMDSLRDKIVLEDQWASERPPWKVW